jgi:hypothetical protein
VELAVNQLDAAAQILDRGRLALGGAIQTIQDGQQLLQRLNQCVLAELLLLARVALAEVIEVGLQAGQAIQVLGVLRLQLSTSPLAELASAAESPAGSSRSTSMAVFCVSSLVVIALFLF